MTTGPDQPFDEEAWQASAEGGPTFEFAEGEEPFEPAFEPAGGGPSEPAGGARRPSSAGGHDRDFSGARRPGRPSAEETQWAAIGHAAGAVSVLVTGGVAGWLVPLIIWLVKREEGGFAADQALEALNFQLTMFLLSLVALPLMCIGVGLLILLAVPVASVIFSVIAAVETWRGRRYAYPINFRLI